MLQCLADNVDRTMRHALEAEEKIPLSEVTDFEEASCNCTMRRRGRERERERERESRQTNRHLVRDDRILFNFRFAVK